MLPNVSDEEVGNGVKHGGKRWENGMALDTQQHKPLLAGVMSPRPLGRVRDTCECGKKWLGLKFTFSPSVVDE